MANQPKQIHEFAREFNTLDNASYLPASQNQETGKISVQNLKQVLGVSGASRTTDEKTLTSNYEIVPADASILLFKPDGSYTVKFPAIATDEEQEYEIYLDKLDHLIAFVDQADAPLIQLGGNSGYAYFTAIAIGTSWVIKPGGFAIIS